MSKKKIVFLGILVPPYCGIGATIRIGREMLCLPYAGFFTQPSSCQVESISCNFCMCVDLFVWVFPPSRLTGASKIPAAHFKENN